MVKKLLAALIGLIYSPAPQPRVEAGRVIGRFRFADSIDPSAFTFRMPAGMPGDVSRFHPASIEPCLIDASAPPTAYGQAVLIDATTQGVRPFAAGDTGVTTIWGVTARPYPQQQTSGGPNSAFGSATPPVSGEIDVARHAYMMVTLGANGTGAAKKGAPVFVWCAAASGNHVQGGFEDAASAGNTAALDTVRYTFNGVPDANGNVEIVINP